MTDSTGERLVVRDEFDDGVSWTVEDDEMERTSHALVVDEDETDERDGVWLIDPIDAAGLDDLVAEYGEVAGVTVLLNRHKRDAAAIARRHDVPVSLPAPLADAAEDLDAETETYAGWLPDSRFRTITVVDNPLWTEVALFEEDSKTLVVPEALGTGTLFVAGHERLGVHPVLRLFPPKKALGDIRPERVLVGHGGGVFEDAATELRRALRTSRKNAPKAYGKLLTLPFQ